MNIAHKCHKNRNGPSTTMEPSIIKEGFLHLAEKGFLITEYIADGDCNTWDIL